MLRRIIIAFLFNTLGLLACGYFVSGFEVDVTNFVVFAVLVAVLTFITLIIRPIIKLVLTPIVVLTFGLFNLVINAGILYIIDKYSAHITISGLPALIYGSIILTISSLIGHFISHHLARTDF